MLSIIVYNVCINANLNILATVRDICSLCNVITSRSMYVVGTVRLVVVELSNALLALMALAYFRYPFK